MKLVAQIWNDLGTYRFARHALVVTSALLALLVVYVGYDYYAAYREAGAHKVFAEGVELYEQALASDAQESQQKRQIRWQEAEAAFKLGYKQFSSSQLAPFFLGYQSEALLKLGQEQEALAVLDAMLSSLGKSSPFYGPYAVKRALIKLDSANLKQEGLAELKKLADDASLASQDLALYHLGEYYWAHDNPALAYDAWKKLRDIGASRTPPMTSPWAQLVAQRLESVA